MEAAKFVLVEVKPTIDDREGWRFRPPISFD